MPTLDAATLIGALVQRLQDSYIFPDRAAAAEQLLRANLDAGKYASPVDEQLCGLINEDLLATCADKHLRLIWHEENDAGESPQSDEDLIAGLREMFRIENYGIRRVERLAGSFLFPDGEVQLSDIIEGPHGPAHQFWTSGYLPGPRYLDRPVYVLVSSATFSGGESLAYDLQALGRVTVVGEVTRGGAHPSIVVSLGDHIELRLPIARTVNPITGTDWEAVGVTPDIVVAADAALDNAHMAILDQVLTRSGIPASVREEALLARS